MKTQIIHFNDKNANKIFFRDYSPEKIDNSDEIKVMRNILSKAISSELTQMQRICLVEHYINRKKQKQIAEELGLNASTVSRHISSARKKLQNIASYYLNTA